MSRSLCPAFRATVQGDTGAPWSSVCRRVEMYVWRKTFWCSSPARSELVGLAGPVPAPPGDLPAGDAARADERPRLSVTAGQGVRAGEPERLPRESALASSLGLRVEAPPLEANSGPASAHQAPLA